MFQFQVGAAKSVSPVPYPRIEVQIFSGVRWMSLTGGPTSPELACFKLHQLPSSSWNTPVIVWRTDRLGATPYKIRAYGGQNVETAYAWIVGGTVQCQRAMVA